MLHNRLFGRRPDRGDLEMLEIPPRNAKFPDAFPHRFDAIGAGEYDPVVSLYIFQGIVEWPVRLRLANLDERDFDYRCAQAAQAGGKAASLMAGAPDKNPGSGEGMFFVGPAHGDSSWLLAFGSQLSVLTLSCYGLGSGH